MCGVARWWYLKGSDSTHQWVCRSTLLCHSRDRHTPACSRLSHEASSKCPQFCKTFHLRGNGLDRTETKLSLFSKCAFFALLNKNAFKRSICSACNQLNCIQLYLTCNSAANFAPTRSDTGAVPNHAILWSLICFTNLVCPEIVLIITGFLNWKQKQWKVWIFSSNVTRLLS